MQLHAPVYKQALYPSKLSTLITEPGAARAYICFETF